MATKEFTVKDYASREQVDPKTVRRWISKGAVDVRRTPGGGVRVIEHQPGAGISGTNSDNHGHSST